MSKSSPPDISVIIPCYNAADTLALQLEALATQSSAPPFEVIIVDNRSTDDTVSIADAWTGRVPGLRIVRADAEQGTSYARNVGAAHASAPRLMFCDADDVVSEWWLAQGREAFESAELWTGGADPIADIEFGLDVAALRKRICDTPILTEADAKKQTDFPVMMGCDFGVTAELYLRLRGFDQSLPISGEDNDFAMRAQALNVPVRHFPSIKIAYRTRSKPKERRVVLRRAARTHVLLATRHRLWAASPHRRWIRASVRWVAAGLKMTLLPKERDWQGYGDRGAYLAGIAQGFGNYRCAWNLPEQRLGVGLSTAHDNLQYPREKGIAIQAPDGWPAQCTRVVIIAHKYPGNGGIETFVTNFTSALTAAGIESRIISVLPGRGHAHLPVDVVFRNEELQTTSVTGRKVLSVRTLILLPRLIWKRVDRWNSLRKLRKWLVSYGSETAVVITKPEFGRLLQQIGIEPTDDGPLLIGQHHSSFESLTHTNHPPHEMSADFRKVDAFLALTKSDADQFSRFMSVPVFAVPNLNARKDTVSHASPHYAGNITRPPASAKKVVLAARLSPEKQIDRAIRAFSAATADPALHDWTFYIYGSGSEELSLSALIATLPEASGRIHLMGWCQDRKEIYGDADVNMLTSSFEGFGMTVIEAAQFGVPTIAFEASGGVGDLVRELGGIAVSPNDDEALRTALAHLLSNTRTLAERGQRAADAVVAYNAPHVLAKWAAVLGSSYKKRCNTHGARDLPREASTN